jgi:hypothetical protein
MRTLIWRIWWRFFGWRIVTKSEIDEAKAALREYLIAEIARRRKAHQRVSDLQRQLVRVTAELAAMK